MTPATLVNDAPVVFDQTEGQPIGDHKNYTFWTTRLRTAYTDPAT